MWLRTCIWAPPGSLGEAARAFSQVSWWQRLVEPEGVALLGGAEPGIALQGGRDLGTAGHMEGWGSSLLLSSPAGLGMPAARHCPLPAATTELTLQDPGGVAGGKYPTTCASEQPPSALVSSSVLSSSLTSSAMKHSKQSSPLAPAPPQGALPRVLRAQSPLRHPDSSPLPSRSSQEERLRPTTHSTHPAGKLAQNIPP